MKHDGADKVIQNLGIKATIFCKFGKQRKLFYTFIRNLAPNCVFVRSDTPFCSFAF